MIKKPNIAIAYNEKLPVEPFREFEDAISGGGVQVFSEEQPDSGPYACPEWFVLPLAAVFIAKSYFDGFLKEAGKEHYHSLKAGLSRLTNNVMGNPRIEPVILGSPGKVSSTNPYTVALSIYAEANDGNRFKLLLPKPSKSENYTEIIYKFLEFLNDFHSGVKVLGDIGFDDSVRPPGGHIFVHLNKETKQIEWLDIRKNL